MPEFTSEQFLFDQEIIEYGEFVADMMEIGDPAPTFIIREALGSNCKIKARQVRLARWLFRPNNSTIQYGKAVIIHELCHILRPPRKKWSGRNDPHHGGFKADFEHWLHKLEGLHAIWRGPSYMQGLYEYTRYQGERVRKLVYLEGVDARTVRQEVIYFRSNGLAIETTSRSPGARAKLTVDQLNSAKGD